MENSKRNLTHLFIFSLIILFPQIISTLAFQQQKQSPWLSHRFREMYSVVTTSSITCWEKLISVVNDVQKRYFPPNLDFRASRVEEKDEQGGKEWMKEAAKKSFEISKSSVEETAKLAAGAVGDAVHKTKEKLNKQHCTGDACHDEL